MALDLSTINYDVINRGAYQIPSVIRTSEPVFDYGQRVLFGKGPRTAQDFLTYNYRKKGIIIPQEAIRGADPNRRNYGSSFDENHIASLYFFDEFVFNAQAAENRVAAEVDLTKPWTIEQRLMYLLAESREEWFDGVKVAREKAIWSTILNAKFSTLNGGEQKFPVQNKLLSIDGSKLFSDWMATLMNACDLVFKAGRTPNEIIFNPLDWANLLKIEDFRAILDNRRIYGSHVETTESKNGVSSVAVIDIPGIGPLKVITYAGMDPDGNYCLPQGKAVLHNGERGKLGACGVYVRSTDGQGRKVQGKQGEEVYSYIYSPEQGVKVDTMVQHQAAPCPMLTAIDRYGVITGIPKNAA